MLSIFTRHVPTENFTSDKYARILAATYRLKASLLFFL